MNNYLIKYINSKQCFKLILGANNENYEEITKLVALYSRAGCKFFDLNASKEAIIAAKKGLEISKTNDAFLCISVGTKNDPHISKCKINTAKCVLCAKCKKVCIQKAINNNSDIMKIDEKKCIGCSQCKKVCPKGAIEQYNKKCNWKEILPELLNLVDCIEFHIISDDKDDIEKKWEYLYKNYKGVLSICTDRSLYSDKELIKQLKSMIEKAGKERCMIQADGAPMSGGKDDYSTTLQAVACADIILKENLSVPVIMSGGANSKTNKLARLCNVKTNGIAVGSYARKKVKDFVECEDFLYNKEKFASALKIAKEVMRKIR